MLNTCRDVAEDPRQRPNSALGIVIQWLPTYIKVRKGALEGSNGHKIPMDLMKTQMTINLEMSTTPTLITCQKPAERTRNGVFV
jgi:hypothetical protein